MKLISGIFFFFFVEYFDEDESQWLPNASTDSRSFLFYRQFISNGRISGVKNDWKREWNEKKIDTKEQMAITKIGLSKKNEWTSIVSIFLSLLFASSFITFFVVWNSCPNCNRKKKESKVWLWTRAYETTNLNEMPAEKEKTKKNENERRKNFHLNELEFLCVHSNYIALH